MLDVVYYTCGAIWRIAGSVAASPPQVLWQAGGLEGRMHNTGSGQIPVNVVFSNNEWRFTYTGPPPSIGGPFVLVVPTVFDPPGDIPVWRIEGKFKTSTLDTDTGVWTDDGTIELRINGTPLVSATNVRLRTPSNRNFNFFIGVGSPQFVSEFPSTHWPGSELREAWFAFKNDYITDQNDPDLLIYDEFHTHWDSMWVPHDATFGNHAAAGSIYGVTNRGGFLTHAGHAYSGLRLTTVSTNPVPTPVPPDDVDPNYPNDPCCVHSSPDPDPDLPDPGSPGDQTRPDTTQIPPSWIPFCSGGADYLSAADPTDSEEWAL